MFHVIPCTLLLLVQAHAAPTEVDSQSGEQIVVLPTASLTWSELQLLDLESPLLPPAPGYEASPYPEPPPPEIGPALEQPSPRTRPSGPRVERAGPCTGFPSEPALSHGFLALPTNNTFYPPDTNGAVGPEHLVTMLNDRVRIHHRSGAAVSTVTLVSFWSAVGGSDVFDPKLIYDRDAGRFVATACADRLSPSSRVLFAISATSDPTETWSFYAFDGDASDTTWVDYPGLGANSLWFAITMNMFTSSSGTYSGAKLWAIDRSTALSGGPLTVTVFPTGFDATGTGGIGFTVLPCRTLDPGATTLYFLYNNFSFGGVQSLRLSQLTGTGAAPVWSPTPGGALSQPGFFHVTTGWGTANPDAPQLGTGTAIETNDYRMMDAVQRNGHVWGTHTGEVGGRVAVFWYEIDPAAMPTPIVQSGVIDGGGSTFHYFPSLAVNCAGDALVGFTRSDPSIYAQAVYTLRLAGDPAGSMGPVRVLKEGEDWYTHVLSGRNRWGDYSVTCVDPVDDTTFWTIQEFARPRNGSGTSGGRWGTWWGRIGECGQPTITLQPVSVVECPGGSALLSVAATTSNSILTYQWRKDGVDLPGETASSLFLDALTAADEGTYDVFLVDGCGTALSSGADVTVLAGVTLDTQPMSLEVCSGDVASFTVSASGGDPLTYQWRKDSIDLAGETGASLVIDPATADDAASYDVVVTAASGCSTVSDAAMLTVLEGPSILADPQPVVVCRHRPAMLEVTATGTAPLTYQWRHDGVDVVGATESTLMILEATMADEGSYDVVVTNGCGSVTSLPALVTVSHAPICKIRPHAPPP